jgi:hypothetical protein
MLTWFFIGFFFGALAPSLAAWIVFKRNQHLRKRLRHWIDKVEGNVAE